MAEKKSPAKQTSNRKPLDNQFAQDDKQPGKTNKSGGKGEQKPVKKTRRYLLYLILIVFVVGLIAAGTVAAANYFGVIDLENIKREIGQTYQLQKYPLIGQYFPEAEQEPAQEQPERDNLQTAESKIESAEEASAAARKNELLALENAEKEKKRKEEEEAKAAQRASRLARLYGEMKPTEAASVMKELEDETVLAIFAKMEDGQVAKILSRFETERAARLTKNMLNGSKPQMKPPIEI